MEVLAFYGVFGAIAAVMVAVGAYRRLRRDDRVWEQVARSLGLSYSHRTIRGHLNGQWVEARKKLTSKGVAEAVITCRLQTPLDLGLAVRHRRPYRVVGDQLADFFARRGGVDVLFGDASFNHRFRVVADESTRAQALLSQPVRQQLSARLAGSIPFTMTDEGIVVETLAVHHGRFMRSMLLLAAQVTGSLEQASSQVPVARGLVEVRQAWAEFAHRRGQLRSTDTPLCLRGRLEGIVTDLRAVRTAPHQYALDILLRFEESLAVGLQLKHRGMDEGLSAVSGGTEHRFDDEAFDDVFHVRLDDVAQGSRLLDEQLRQHLLAACDSLGPLLIRDAELSVRLPHVPPEPEGVLRTVRGLNELARHIQEKAARLRSQRRGPYR